MVKTINKPPNIKPQLEINTKLTWMPDKTFELEFTLPWEKVKNSFQKTLKDLAKTTEIKGFRKGKAPLKVVEKNIDKSKLYTHVINQLLPVSYTSAVKKHHLNPAVSPKIEILKAEENQDWQFKAISCELPEVKLNDYQQSIKAALAKEKIWTPDQGDPQKPPKENYQDTSKKLNQIFTILLKSIELKLPGILLEKEVQRLLSQLLDQVNKLGLTIEQYAQSNQKTIEQLKTEHQLIAENNLKLELILQSIANDQKITVNDEEIDKMIEAAGDQKLKEKLNTPSERAYIATVLKKRRAIDYLLSL